MADFDFLYDSYDTLPIKTIESHQTAILSCIDKFEAGHGECALIHALIHSRRLQPALEYLKQQISTETEQMKSNISQLYNNCEEKHTRCALLSCIAESSRFKEIEELGFDCTEYDLKYAKQRASEGTFSILTNSVEQQGTVRVSQIKSLRDSLEQLSSEKSIDAKSQPSPEALLVSEVITQNYISKSIETEKMFIGKKDNDRIPINQISFFNGELRNRFSSTTYLYEQCMKTCGYVMSLSSFRLCTQNITLPMSRIDECEHCLRYEFLKRRLQQKKQLNEKELEELKNIELHKEHALIQRQAYIHKINNPNPKELVLVIDFAEDFTLCREQTQTGTSHFDHQNVTFLNMVAYRQDGKFSRNFLSETVNHDSRIVIECLQDFFEKEKMDKIESISIISDNGPHFKSKQLIDYIFSPNNAYLKNLTIEYIFFVERHGKSACDSDIGETKRTLYQYLPPAGIGDINELQTFLEEKCKRSAFPKEFLIHHDDDNFEGKIIELDNIRTYLYFARFGSSKEAYSYAYPLYGAKQKVRINLDEKDHENKIRRHSKQQEKVAETVTSDFTLKITSVRDEMMKDPIQDIQEEIPIPQMVKRKRRRVDDDFDDESSEVQAMAYAQQMKENKYKK
ncbi:MAG: hypothetical protein EZS28_018296 [Streblomastix strix]|uniref:Uncharacterized protein n=1 Tax=Streblomastix strix TaxID=222440 RepID=A0A5J4VUB0_9EUKA|nr:MAG: hypothetical protein EZS28_018296 [Streblomastix strix]